MNRLLPTITALLLLMASSLLNAQQSYHVTEFPGLTWIDGGSGATIPTFSRWGSKTDAFGINDLGEVAAGDRIYSGSTVTLLPKTYTLPQAPSWWPNEQYGWDVNNSGVVVGHGGYNRFNAYNYPTYLGNGSYQHGFVYEFGNATSTDVGLLPGGLESRLFAINESGQAVGWAYQLNGPAMQQQAAIYENGVLTNLHNQVKLNGTDQQSAIFAITDSGKIAGFSVAATGHSRAFSNNGTASTALGTFGGNNSVALGASEAETVGWAEDVGGNRTAFVHDGATLTNLKSTFTGGLATKVNSIAAAINESGIIVGKAYDSVWSDDPVSTFYGEAGFVSDGNQTWSLTSLVDSTSSWTVLSASDINASGQIAAKARSSNSDIGSGVVLTPETIWTGTGNGTWDATSNWQGAALPGTQGAARLLLADGITVAGPSTSTTLYALTVGSSTVNGTATLQTGAGLTVNGDTELRSGAFVDASSAPLNTSFLHGNGTVSGELNAGYIYTRSTQSMVLSGNVTATQILASDSSTIETSGNVEADNVLLGSSATLRTSGTVHAAITGFGGTALYLNGSQLGRIQLTGNSTLGGVDIAPSVVVNRIELGGHSATLLTSGNASHRFTDLDFAGGEITASTGIRLSGLGSGPGNVTGNVHIQGGILQPGIGGNLSISGNLTGSGLLVGPNIQVSGTSTPGNATTIFASTDLGTEDAVLFGNGRARLAGAITMGGGNITAADGVWLAGSIAGSGNVNGSIVGFGTITANGSFTLGDASSSSGVELNALYRYGYYSSWIGYVPDEYRGTLNAGNHTVTLLDADHAVIRNVNLAGGTVNAANGLETNRITGHGVVSGPVNAWDGIIASGNLTLGSATSADGVMFANMLDVGAHTVTLLDADGAVQYGYGEVKLSGGSLHSVNGLELYSGSKVRASGSNATSTILGNLTVSNAIIEATATNALAISGTLSGYGVLLGNVTASQMTATEGDVVIGDNLNIGERSMTFLSLSRALLGGQTTIQGGTVGATNGIELSSRLAGYGTINPGASQTLLLTNGILDIDAGQSLNINGGVEGYGVVIGDMAVSGANTLASAPSGRAFIGQAVSVGNRTATFYSNNSTILPDYGSVSIDGGSLVASAGIRNSGLISGNGTVHGDTQLQSGILSADSGKQLSVNGTLSGHGVTVGNVTATTSTLGTPTGTVSISRTLAIGSQTATVHSDAKSYLSNVTSNGGTLVIGTHGAEVNEYTGTGTLNGNVSMTNGLYVIDVDGSLDITGTFTGYGIVVGTHNKAITAPTGSVNRDNLWVIGRNDVTVYSQGTAYAAEATLSDGGRIFSAAGWDFGGLAGSGTLGGNVTIQSILSPGFSPGTLVFEDDLTLTGSSTTEIEFAGTGAGEYDFLNVVGALTMGGTLQVSFLDGFDPSAGLLPDWIDAASFNGNFSNISWSGLGEDKALSFNSSNGALAVVAIPEPSTCALIALGSAAMLLSRRRNKKA